MIAPLRHPPARKTTHGALMSDRLCRLYTWLQANGVALTDFSTDEHVQREMPKLMRLQLELQTEIDIAPAFYLDHLAADLGAIMRRVPANRVTR